LWGKNRQKSASYPAVTRRMKKRSWKVKVMGDLTLGQGLSYPKKAERGRETRQRPVDEHNARKRSKESKGIGSKSPTL